MATVYIQLEVFSQIKRNTYKLSKKEQNKTRQDHLQTIIMASNPETSPATSPKQTIQFKEPFDGRKLTHRSSVLASLTCSGRLSASDYDAIEDDEDHYQDWTKTTDERDSWAARERRRSSVWQKIDAYPAAHGITTITTTTTKKSPSNSMNEGRRGSILSMWTHGKDKLGHDVLHSGEAHDHDREVDELKPATSNEAPEIKERTDRRGSILSMFSHGKDKHGKHVIISGFEDDD
jgi:hypothetical protein